jgi:hypothetical protein
MKVHTFSALSFLLQGHRGQLRFKRVPLRKRRIASDSRGFFLLETVITLILIALVFWVSLRFFSVGSAHLRTTRLRTVASSLASEQLELIRTLQYGAVGLSMALANPWYLSEIPVTATPGIPAEQTITRSGTDFRIQTWITFVDSPDDGVGADDPDGPQDYKRVFTVVGWPGGTTVRMSSLVAP